MPLALSALALGAWHTGAQAHAHAQSSPMPDGGRSASGSAPAFDGLAARIPVEYPDVQSVSVVRLALLRGTLFPAAAATPV